MFSSIFPVKLNSLELPRLISLLLQIHPNTFSTILASSRPSKIKGSNALTPIPPSTLTLESIAGLDRELGLGLDLGRTNVESDCRQYGTIEKDEYQRVNAFDWKDVLQAYITFPIISKSAGHSGRSSPATSSSRVSSIDSHLPLLPPVIQELIAHVHAHSLPREPIELPAYSQKGPRRTVGMSPKKAHEVTRMAAYVASVAQNLRTSEGVYIVDVGAGQGHLARELLHIVPGVKGVLALDGDPVLVERQANPTKTQARTREKEKTSVNETETDRGNMPEVTHKFGHITSPERLVEAVNEWFMELEAKHALRSKDVRSDNPIPVILVSLHGCGSLSLDVLRAFVRRRYEFEGIQPERQKWGFIASVTVPCCYNLLRQGEYPLSASLSSPPSSQSQPELPLPESYPTLSPSKNFLPHPLPPNAYHLAAQVPDTWLQSGSANSSTFIQEAQIGLSPSVSASLAVRKVVWRALLEWVFVQKGIDRNEIDILSGLGDKPRKPGFIPPMEANAYLQNGPNNSQGPTSSFSSTSCSASPPLAGKIGSNLEQGRLGRLGRFPPRAYESWATFLDLASSRLGIDLDIGSDEQSASTNTSSLGSVQFMSSLSSTPTQMSDSDSETNFPSVCATLPPLLVPLARALSILYVLRCILGPLVESALLDDRVRWVRGQLADKDGPTVIPANLENLEGKMRSEVKLKYEASLVPLFTQHGESGSPRNIALVVVPKHLSVE
ncbi:methyltransferase domain-containing protein [Lentinula boryana]|uniref:Methyltransferase domain-containing protein n=1 Tax=Lentinula boryana TaxID=40481 RepID=A0ABQ8QD88_9AGAR|nr:methyltransferase domain-containing protein [Lentinula boryana]